MFARGKSGALEHWWWMPNSNAILHDSWGSGVAQDPTALLIGAQQHVWATGNNGNVLHWYWDPNANAIKQDNWGQ